MLKLLKRILDHPNESIITKMPFDMESYRNGFMRGRFAFVELRVGILPAKAVLCKYNPLISIHVAKKVENEKPLALIFSKTRTDKWFQNLISLSNKW